MLEKVKFSHCIFLLLIFILLVLHLSQHLSTAEGFKLRDLNAPDRSSAESKTSGARKTPKDDQTATPQFMKIVKVVHVSDDGTETEEEFEFKFEKVHKTDYSKSKPIFKTIEEEDAKEEDKTVEEETKQISFSLTALLSLFGVGETVPGVRDDNRFINWLKSFKKGDNPTVTVNNPEESIATFDLSDSLLSYLNRWPFNLFIKFEKMLENKTNESVSAPQAGDKPSIIEPLSQDKLESLLNHLPNFMLSLPDIEDMECRKQLQIFHRQLRGHRLWTLQMLDANAKIASGILRGNINLFGDFEFCTDIKTIVKVTKDQTVKVKGKYCLAHIDFYANEETLKLPVHLATGKGLFRSNLENPSHFVPRYTTANLGVCVPHKCSAETIETMMQKTFQVYNSTGLVFQIQVTNEDCYVRKNQSFSTLLSVNWKITLTVVYLSTVILSACCATIFDNWNFIKINANSYFGKILKTNSNDEIKSNGGDSEPSREPDENSEISSGIGSPVPYVSQESEERLPTLTEEVILSFSLKRTIPYLSDEGKIDDEITSLHLLKIVSTFFIYIFLKFLLIGHLPITNRESVVKFFTLRPSIFLRSPLLYLDSLLFISGTLASYRCCQEMEQKSSIPVLRRFVGKLVRAFPVIFAILYFQTWLLPQLSSGPLWSTIIGQNSKICEQNMWRNFFCAQNLLNLEETCSPLTIQFAVDFQLFLLAPLIVWLYYSNSDIGLAVYGSFHAASVSARYYRTVQDRLSPIVFHGMNISQFYRTANVLYASPLYRASPFLFGVGLGIFLKNTPKDVKLPQSAIFLGWTSALWCLFWCFWYPSNATQIDFSYDPGEAAVYSAWAPILLSATLGWLIFMSWTQRDDSLMTGILSSRPVVYLSRISYPMQLVLYVVVMSSTASTKEAHRFDIVSDFINVREILGICIASTVLAIFFDIPMQNIRKLLIEHEFPEVHTDVMGQIEGGHFEELEAPPSDNENIEENDTYEENADENSDDTLKENEDPSDDIWMSKVDDSDKVEKTNSNSNAEFSWDEDNVANDVNNDELSESESDINQQSDGANNANVTKPTEQKPNEEEEDEDEDEEEEISEAEEVIHRPATPEDPPKFDESSYRRRRRWNTEDD